MSEQRSPISDDTASTPKRWITWPRILVVVLVGLLVFAAWAWQRWQGEPEGYFHIDRELAALDSSERKLRADDFQELVIRAAQGYMLDPRTQKVQRSDGPDSEPVRLPDGQPQVVRWDWVSINTWLSDSLPEWRDKGLWPIPAETTDFRVREHNGRLMLGFRFRSGGMDQVISVIVGIELNEEGYLRLDFQRVYAGALPLPWFILRPMLIGAIEQVVMQPLPELIALLEGEWVKAQLDAEVGMDRDVRLLDLDITHEGLAFTISFHTPEIEADDTEAEPPDQADPADDDRATTARQGRP